MSLIRRCFTTLMVGILVCFYTFTALMTLLTTILRKGPRATFYRKNRNQPPKCMQDPSLGAHSYIHLEEVRLHYVSTGSDGKPLMILVHGFPEFWYSWRYQLKEFKDSYRVVAVDQRGYGDSDKPTKVSSYDVTKLVDDIRQLIFALGHKQCVLVGHDWGGNVAWKFAQSYPKLLTKLIILNCPTTAAYQKHVRSSISQLRKSWYIFFFQVPYLPELFLQMCDFQFMDRIFAGVLSGKTTPEDVEAYKFTFSRGGFTAPVNYYRQAVRSPDFGRVTKADLKKISVPTLIIWGDQDLALETPLATLSSEESVEGGATVKIIEGASHWVQMDRPDLVNKYMREFLASA